MALGMSESAFSAKEKFLDELEEQFLKNVKDFTSDVKKTMRNASRQCAMEIFEMAIVFLTQVFPNPTSIGASLCDSDDIQSVSKRLSDVETKETLIEKKLNKGLEKISGLRKLQTVILKERIKASQTAAATTTATSSGLASAAATTAQQRPVQKLSAKAIFSVKVPEDTKGPCIVDIKLLPGGLVLLADFGNKCLKLYNQSGSYVKSQILDRAPLRLAVMDDRSLLQQNVALTLQEKSLIVIHTISSVSMSLKIPIRTAKPCCAIAAVDAKTLAVGYFDVKGIDLIDLSGRVLRQISSHFRPNYMMTTSDECLVISFGSNEIATINLANGDTSFVQKVEHLQNLWGITHHKDGFFLATNDYVISKF
ncbi:hypothetical protein RRG08_005396 [Elysia crispata]|uniref:Uncharacterized protein n=1 Tax=Elysia crispata TaxID=231223 RepID=A0AAE0XXV5_9GAST|nr:hypothetical protein RRG08_005396 [Elysia crispata]